MNNYIEEFIQITEDLKINAPKIAWACDLVIQGVKENEDKLDWSTINLVAQQYTAFSKTLRQQYGLKKKLRFLLHLKVHKVVDMRDILWKQGAIRGRFNHLLPRLYHCLSNDSNVEKISRGQYKLTGPPDTSQQLPQ